MTSKDDVLADLADRVNVAQFVSFGPDASLPLRHTRVRGLPPGTGGPAHDAVAHLLRASGQGAVNIRTFVPRADGASRGTPFDYGLTSVDEVLALLRRRARDGYHTIVNETVAVDDGGVSGVAFGGLVEFAPDDTPRCVEKPGTTALPQPQARRLFELVYGVRAELPDDTALRVEFSVHPLRTGVRSGHTLVWEQERVDAVALRRSLTWPSRFSRLLGDKAFGLLVAHLAGLPVPATTVVGRRVAPFSFGTSTGTAEAWLRTAPAEPVPGRHPTTFGWRDPYRLLADDDPPAVASVLAQESVAAAWSGALLAAADRVRVEGVAGRGDEFMLGRRAPQELPEAVAEDVRRLAGTLVGRLGSVRVEWVHDGERVWIVQLQQVAPPAGDPAVIAAGDAATWRVFDTEDGLDALRAVLVDLEPGEGMVLRGAVGVTSHFGDLLRRAGVPSRLEPPASPV